MVSAHVLAAVACVLAAVSGIDAACNAGCDVCWDASAASRGSWSQAAYWDGLATGRASPASADRVCVGCGVVDMRVDAATTVSSRSLSTTCTDARTGVVPGRISVRGTLLLAPASVQDASRVEARTTFAVSGGGKVAACDACPQAARVSVFGTLDTSQEAELSRVSLGLYGTALWMMRETGVSGGRVALADFAVLDVRSPSQLIASDLTVADDALVSVRTRLALCGTGITTAGAGRIELSQSGASITLGDGAECALGTQLINRGAVVVDHVGLPSVLSVSVVNDGGQIQLQRGEAQLTAGFTQNKPGSAVFLAPGTRLTSPSVAISGGVVAGAGTIASTEADTVVVDGSGVLAAESGDLTIAADLDMTQASVLRVSFLADEDVPAVHAHNIALSDGVSVALVFQDAFPQPAEADRTFLLASCSGTCSGAAPTISSMSGFNATACDPQITVLASGVFVQLPGLTTCVREPADTSGDGNDDEEADSAATGLVSQDTVRILLGTSVALVLCVVGVTVARQPSADARGRGAATSRKRGAGKLRGIQAMRGVPTPPPATYPPPQPSPAGARAKPSLPPHLESHSVSSLSSAGTTATESMASAMMRSTRVYEPEIPSESSIANYSTSTSGTATSSSSGGSGGRARLVGPPLDYAKVEAMASASGSGYKVLRRSQGTRSWRPSVVSAPSMAASAQTGRSAASYESTATSSRSKPTRQAPVPPRPGMLPARTFDQRPRGDSDVSGASMRTARPGSAPRQQPQPQPQQQQDRVSTARRSSRSRSSAGRRHRQRSSTRSASSSARVVDAPRAATVHVVQQQTPQQGYQPAPRATAMQPRQQPRRPDAARQAPGTGGVRRQRRGGATKPTAPHRYAVP